jgi:hypothetical protein
MLLGGVCLIPLQAFSLAQDWLKQVAVTSGPAVAGQMAFSPLQQEMVAVGYQLGYLVLPRRCWWSGSWR